MGDNNRYMAFDMVRALCALYIVGFWHLNGYLADIYRFKGECFVVLHNVTCVVLGLFSFMSGFFLNKYSFEDYHDIEKFAIKRFKRFFVLFLLSVLSFYFLKWISLSQIVQLLLGLNLFFGESVSTLWFSSMVIFFYFLTPVINYSYKSPNLSAVFIITLFAVFAVLSFLKIIDERFLPFFACYVLGLKMDNDKLNLLLSNKSLFLILIICTVILLFLPDNLVLISVVPILICVIGLLMVSIKVYNILDSRFDRMIAFLSEGSMVAYLFHRQVFGFVSFFCERFFGIKYVPIVVSVFTVILTFLLSYIIKKIYNKIVI